eukprot:6460038-Amphidinium_carterae.2
MEPPLARIVAALPHARFVAEVLLEVGLVSVDALLALGAESASAFGQCLHALCPPKQAELVTDFMHSFHRLFALVTANITLLDKEAVWMAMIQTQHPQDASMDVPIASSVSLAPSRLHAQPKTTHSRDLQVKTASLRRMHDLISRAGSHVDVSNKFQGSEWAALSDTDKRRLQDMILSDGSAHTMRNYLREFERFEKWCEMREFAVWPWTEGTIARYAQERADQGCGPAVLPAFRAALSWIAKKLGHVIPPAVLPVLVGLEKQVRIDRSLPLREAVAMPLDMVRALEQLLCSEADISPGAAQFAFIVLFAVYGSLRFDDLLHIKPSSIANKSEGIVAEAWQTKTTRGRATKIVIPNVSLSGQPWQEVGIACWRPLFTEEAFASVDFLACRVEEHGLSVTVPSTHARFQHDLRWVVDLAITHEQERAGFLLTKLGVCAMSCPGSHATPSELRW